MAIANKWQHCSVATAIASRDDKPNGCRTRHLVGSFFLDIAVAHDYAGTVFFFFTPGAQSDLLFVVSFCAGLFAVRF